MGIGNDGPARITENCAEFVLSRNGVGRKVKYWKLIRDSEVAARIKSRQSTPRMQCAKSRRQKTQVEGSGTKFQLVESALTPRKPQGS